MVADIVAVLVAIGFAYAVWHHTRYRSPEERQQERIRQIVKTYGKSSRRDVGPVVSRHYRTLDEQRELAEQAARRQHTDHPRDEEGRLR